MEEFSQHASPKSIDSAVKKLIEHLMDRGTFEVYLNLNGGLTPEQILAIQADVLLGTHGKFTVTLKCIEYVDPDKTYWILSITEGEFLTPPT